MKAKALFPSWARVLFPLVGVCALACGGNVNLGGDRGSDASVVFSASEGETVPDEEASVVASFADDFNAEGLVVAGDFLYLNGYDARGPRLIRCEKASCRQTAQFMLMPDQVSWMQVYEGRLGVVTIQGSFGSIASYALPDLTREEIVIGGLPLLSNQPVLLHQGFAFWSLPLEEGLYRCALPDCGSGPERLQPYSASGAIRAEGDLVFWTTGGLKRAGELGKEPAQHLVPDEQLNPTTADEPSAELAYESHAIAVAGGMLYAAYSQTLCVDQCQWTLARWPVRSGPRQVLVETALAISGVFVLSGEVAWVERDPSREDGELFSCLAESCAQTRRELGTVRGAAGVASDERNWYWLAAQDTGPDELGRPRWSHRQLRRTPLIRSEAP